MITKLITRLNGVKRTGQNRYVALCPAHADRAPSLSVTERDGHVLFHCFAGCTPQDVLDSVGLEFKDLYPEKLSNEYLYGGLNAKKISFNPYDVLKCLKKETIILCLAADQLSRNVPLGPDDIESLRKASKRIEDAAQLMGIKS